MDAILFSADPTLVNINDAVSHLINHDELYWEVGFLINRDQFHYPILGYIHICGRQVQYVATIKSIIPFTSIHYEDPNLSIRVKPSKWMKEWREDINNIRTYHWKNVLVISQIKPFFFDTYGFKKYDGSFVTKAPQNYVRVLRPI